MPLKSGTKRETISRNIRHLIHKGYPKRQAVAIALSHARRTAQGRLPYYLRENPSSHDYDYWIGFAIIALGVVAIGSLFAMTPHDRKKTIGI
jgi:hypothetical protein